MTEVTARIFEVRYTLSMNTQSAIRIIQWSARIVAIAFIIFISMFALDVFGQKDWLLALLIHLVPSYILVFLTVVAWKNDLLGGVLFIIGGIIFIGISRFEGYVIYIPAIVLGVLFLLAGWLKRMDEQRRKAAS